MAVSRSLLAHSLRRNRRNDPRQEEEGRDADEESQVDTGDSVGGDTFTQRERARVVMAQNHMLAFIAFMYFIYSVSISVSIDRVEAWIQKPNLHSHFRWQQVSVAAVDVRSSHPLSAFEEGIVR
jgi:hypothetical protein